MGLAQDLFTQPRANKLRQRCVQQDGGNSKNKLATESNKAELPDPPSPHPLPSPLCKLGGVKALRGWQ